MHRSLISPFTRVTAALVLPCVNAFGYDVEQVVVLYLLAYVVGTFDTKGRELFFLRNCLEKRGLRVVTDILDGIDDVSFCRLTSHDVVRHKLVGRIVDAYEKYDAKRAT